MLVSKLLIGVTEQDARLEKLIESEKANIPSNEDMLSTGNQIIDKHIEAFKNLADGEKWQISKN